MEEIHYDFEEQYGPKEGYNNICAKCAITDYKDKDPILCIKDYGNYQSYYSSGYDKLVKDIGKHGSISPS